MYSLLSHRGGIGSKGTPGTRNKTIIGKILHKNFLTFSKNYKEGIFPKMGRLLQKDISCVATSRLSCTAYVLLCLL